MVVGKTGFYFIQKKSKRPIPLSDGIVIGRGNDCKIVIKDERISSNHLKIEVTDEECFIVDLGTKNGTAVNGQRINANIQFKLYHNDIVKIGKYEFQFIDEKLTSRLGQSTEDIDKTCTNVDLSMTLSANEALADANYKALNLNKEKTSRTKSRKEVNLADDNYSSRVIEMDLGEESPTRIGNRTRSVKPSSGLGLSYNEQLLRELYAQKQERENRYQMKVQEVQKLVESKSEFHIKQDEAQDLVSKIKATENKKTELIKLIGTEFTPDVDSIKNEIHTNKKLITSHEQKIAQLEGQINQVRNEIIKLNKQNGTLANKLTAIENIQGVETELANLKSSAREYKYYNDFNLKELDRKLMMKEKERDAFLSELDEYDQKISHQKKKVSIEQEAQRRLEEKQLQKEIVKLQRKLDSVKKK